MAISLADKISKLMDARVWENPICRVTVKTSEKHPPDVCRYLGHDDGDSVYQRVRKEMGIE